MGGNFPLKVDKFFERSNEFAPLKTISQLLVQYVSQEDKRGTSSQVDKVLMDIFKVLDPEFTEQAFKQLVTEAYDKHSFKTLNEAIDTATKTVRESLDYEPLRNIFFHPENGLSANQRQLMNTPVGSVAENSRKEYNSLARKLNNARYTVFSSVWDSVGVRAH